MVSLLASCAVLKPTSSWNGTYTDGRFSLSLSEDKHFTYQGRHYINDVGGQFRVSGTFTTEGDWLTVATAADLEFLRTHSNGGFYERFYKVEADGTAMLFSDLYLANIANSVHNDREAANSPVSPLRLDGKDFHFGAPLENWLPAPYLSFAFGNPIAGQVISVDDVKTTTIYNPVGGAIEGRSGTARLTISVGARNGVFKGMRFCSPERWRWERGSVDELTEDRATFSWRWNISTTSQPTTGMPVTTSCRFKGY